MAERRFQVARLPGFATTAVLVFLAIFTTYFVLTAG